MTRGRRNILLIIVLCLLWGGVRLSNASSTMTTDETLWQGRSANFYNAIANSEFGKTYQMAHPGVPVMWAGGLGVLVTCPEILSVEPFDDLALVDSSRKFRDVGCDPHQVLVAQRVAKVVIQALMVGVALWLLSTMIPGKGVAVAGLLMALSPWQAGLDQLLHVDGMFATASLLTLAAASTAIYRTIRSPNEPGRKSMAAWFGVGVCLAIAMLTRSAGIVFALPIALGILYVAVYRSRFMNRPNVSTGTTGYALRAGLSFVAGTLVFVIILFPALWVNPVQITSHLLGFTDTAITSGHESVLFYNGEVISGDPGAWFYLDVLYWRSTPVEVYVLVVTLALVVAGLFRFRGLHLQRSTWILLTMAAGFVLLYATGISIAAKKFDRYFIMVAPIVSILGGLVVAELRRSVSRRSARTVLGTAVTVLLVVQVMALAGSRPYMLDYFNPIPGGQSAAAGKFQLGWGQGSDQVTDWLVDAGGNEPLVVRSSTQIGVFTVFVPLDSEVQFARGPIETVADWCETDYYVSGFQQRQRYLDRSYHLFAEDDPVYTVTVGALIYFEIYEVNSQPVPEELQADTSCRE